MTMKIIFQNSFLILMTTAVVGFASDNMRYHDKYIKKMSKKNSCYFHIEINGNTDWNKKKQELNTILNRKNANNCFKITIFKKIHNVYTRNASNSSDKLYDINIGSILKGYSGDVVVYTEVVDSKFGTNGRKPVVTNAGIVKHKDPFDDDMQNIDNNVKMKNSQFGTGF